jgi:hypothetical protein
MRVLLTKLPLLLRDVLSEALSGESDMAVVSQTPDVVVMQGTRAEAEAVLHASEGARVLAIDPDGIHAIVLGDDEPIVLSDVSPTTIVMAIRGTSIGP